MKVLIAPLDWGLGHATRCIPVIKAFLGQGATVCIGADGPGKAVLEKEFPDLEHFTFPGTSISYGSNTGLAILSQVPGFLLSIKKEHQFLEREALQRKIDLVISDNRYGLWTKQCKTVLITHQPFVKAPVLPFMEIVVQKRIRLWMDRFDHCWIPDCESVPNLSGDLSHKAKLSANTKFIGPLSRFKNSGKPHGRSGKILVILSGPEPQRTWLEKEILKQIPELPYQFILARGNPGLRPLERIPGNAKVHEHLDSEEMEKAILSSDAVISRPGYSTVMDLSVLGSKAGFIPTPGQTEQEYLAFHFNRQGMAAFSNQQTLDLKELISRALEGKPLKLLCESKVEEEVRTFLNS